MFVIPVMLVISVMKNYLMNFFLIFFSRMHAIVAFVPIANENDQRSIVRMALEQRQILRALRAERPYWFVFDDNVVNHMHGKVSKKNEARQLARLDGK